MEEEQQITIYVVVVDYDDAGVLRQENVYVGFSFENARRVALHNFNNGVDDAYLEMWVGGVLENSRIEVK